MSKRVTWVAIGVVTVICAIVLAIMRQRHPELFQSAPAVKQRRIRQPPTASKRMRMEAGLEDRTSGPSGPSGQAGQPGQAGQGMTLRAGVMYCNGEATKVSILERGQRPPLLFDSQGDGITFDSDDEVSVYELAQELPLHVTAYVLKQEGAACFLEHRTTGERIPVRPVEWPRPLDPTWPEYWGQEVDREPTPLETPSSPEAEPGP